MDMFLIVLLKTRTMSVPPEKLQNIIHMCTEFIILIYIFEYCSKRELQYCWDLSYMCQNVSDQPGNSSTKLTV